jgi:hypothetical protein
MFVDGIIVAVGALSEVLEQAFLLLQYELKQEDVVHLLWVTSSEQLVKHVDSLGLPLHPVSDKHEVEVLLLEYLQIYLLLLLGYFDSKSSVIELLQELVLLFLSFHSLV